MLNAGSRSVVASTPRRGWKTPERVSKVLCYSGNLIHVSVRTRNFTSHCKEPEQGVCNGKVLHLRSKEIISVLKSEGAERVSVLSELRGYLFIFFFEGRGKPKI